MYLPTTALLFLATAFNSAQAHTLFTNFFIDGTPQGDGTCVRMSNSIPHATSPLPVSSIETSDMACGKIWIPQFGLLALLSSGIAVVELHVFGF